jgi:hypothetical protein
MIFFWAPTAGMSSAAVLVTILVRVARVMTCYLEEMAMMLCLEMLGMIFLRAIAGLIL